MAAEPFIGEVIMFAGNFAPRDWAFCEGQLLSINSNQALFSLLGTIYGGDGRTTFGLPDLRGRVPLHPGTGPGLSSNNLGARDGSEDIRLTTSNLPAHNHTIADINTNIPASTTAASEAEPAPNFVLGGATVYSDNAANTTVKGPVISGVSTENTGSSTDADNRQPYLAIHFIIALIGIFPSRN
ncbi:MAG: tail fiber protein [Thiotrichaceae bacterium]